MYPAQNFLINVAWENAELSDLLLLYKQMVLGGLRKDNWKELSKRMSEAGWERNNDHCRHEVKLEIYYIVIKYHPHLTSLI